MGRINVTICTGTTCYVMGAGNLLSIKEHMDEKLAELVDIEGSNCLDFCKDESSGHAPFAKVNNVMIVDATITKIIEEIRRQSE